LSQAQSELAVKRVPEEVCVLHEEGLVQAQVGSHLPDLFRRGILPEQEDHWIAHILKQ
jgi:hypothetical protein